MEPILRGRWVWVLLVSLAAGCGADGPDLGSVSGTVTLDDRPLPDALVEFVPEYGRLSSGVTDADGRYELLYTRNRPGALPGSHRVRISTYRPADMDGNGARVPGAPEQAPAVYNRESTLVREVSAGRQQIDFALESNAGPIVQPDGRR